MDQLGNDDIGDKNVSKPMLKKVKEKRKNHSQLGPDFVAPDGGFGWFICFAAGVSNVSGFFSFMDFVMLNEFIISIAKFSSVHSQCCSSSV